MCAPQSDHDESRCIAQAARLACNRTALIIGSAPCCHAGRTSYGSTAFAPSRRSKSKRMCCPTSPRWAVVYKGNRVPPSGLAIAGPNKTFFGHLNSVEHLDPRCLSRRVPHRRTILIGEAPATLLHTYRCTCSNNNAFTAQLHSAMPHMT